MRVGVVVGGWALCALAAACGSDVADEPERTWPDVAVDAAPVVLKRLTQSQYTNVVIDLLGEEIAVPISLEPDDLSAGFLVVGGSLSSISALGVERYEAAAYDIAEQAMELPAVRAAIVPCTPSGGVSDSACATMFVEQLGRRVFRRSLSEDEVSRYVGIAGEAAEKLGDFHQGLTFALAGLLQSPHFLFRVELGESADGNLRYSNDEMATRLSFFLWNTTPDDELLDAAAAGELTDDAGLVRQIDRMLASDKAREGVRNFFAERFELHRLDDLVKDGELFTSMSADLGPFAREETLLTIEDLVFDRDGDYRELFTTRRTFINRKLAALYGVAAPHLEDFAETTLPEDGPRAGLLGHASVLALYAHATSTSATLRGKFMRTVLLCQEVPPPLADVDTSLPEADMTFPTLRDRIELHMSDPSCATCHRLLDPIGLSLEQFDGIGKFRLVENDETIDPSGELDGAAFSDALGLGRAIAEHELVASCLTRHLYRYAIGTQETLGERDQINQLAEQFAHDGFRIKPLLKRVAMSDGFRLASAASEEVTP